MQINKVICKHRIQYTPLRNQKRGPGRSYSKKYLSFGAKIVKIGPVDPEITCLHLKKRKKRRKVKFIERSAT